MTTDQLTGLTKLTCEFNLIDHVNGDQYHYVKVETEVPTIAGDWDDSGRVAEVFEDVISAIVEDNDDFTLDEGVTYYRDGDLMA
jgi:hypothetical protein